MIRRSRVVIVICPALEDTVRGIDPAAHVGADRERAGLGARSARRPAQAAAVRAALGLAPATPVVLYTGTFEAYQGLDLLFAAMASCASAARRAARAGRRQAGQVAQAREQAARGRHRATSTIFTGERPAEEIPAYLLGARRAGVAAHRAARTRR